MQIRVRKPELDFTMVPNHVWNDPRLSVEAKGVLGYMMQFPEGYTLRVPEIMATLGLGKDKWQRIRRELVAAGAIVSGYAQKTTGEMVGSDLHVQWPENHREPGNQAAGKPGASEPENPAHPSRETRLLNKKRKTKGVETGKAGRDPTRFAQYKATARPLETFEEWEARQ